MTSKIDEIIYASSQKSAITGKSGFGIRTYTEGMDLKIISAVESSDIIGYRVQPARTVSLAQLQDNPKIVYDYAPKFIYKKIKDKTGNELYVFCRSVYIGIDYGYFCGSENAMRAGSNYITHVLVFAERPDKNIFMLLLKNNYFNNNIFLPVDYTCSPDNRELNKLLCGEPKLLMPNEIINSQNMPLPFTENIKRAIDGIGQLLIGNKINKTEKKHFIIRAHNDQITEIVAFIKTQILEQVADSLTFYINYDKTGIPDDCDIVCVDEEYNGQLYEQQQICLNLLNDSNLNYVRNDLSDYIHKLIWSEDKDKINAFLKFIVNLDIDENTNQNFIPSLYALTQTNEDFPFSKIDASLINNLNNSHLDTSNKSKVWGKINDSINSEIQRNSNIVSAIKIANLSSEINIDIKSRQSINDYFFCEGKNSTALMRLWTTNEMPLLFQYFDKKMISKQSFFYTLNNIDSTEIWTKLISFYLGSSFSDELIEMIFKSIQNPLHFITETYPTKQYIKEIKNFFFTHEDNRTLIYPALRDYYTEEIESDPLSGINDILNFLNGFKDINEANSFGIGKLFDKFTDIIREKPNRQYSQIVENILGMKIAISQKSKDFLEQYMDVLNAPTPEVVTTEYLNLTKEISDTNKQKEVFEKWIESSVTNEELIEYLKREKPTQLSKLIMAVWRNTNRDTAMRKELIMTIVENAKWDNQDKTSFMDTPSYMELKEYIKSNLAAKHKFMYWIKHIFSKKQTKTNMNSKKNQKILLIIFIILGTFQISEAQIFSSPYSWKALNLKFYVRSYTEKTYTVKIKRGNPLKSTAFTLKQKHFNVFGYVDYDSIVNKSGATKCTRYKYDGPKLVGINVLGKKNTNYKTEYNDGNLISEIFHTGTHVDSLLYTYNDDGNIVCKYERNEEKSDSTTYEYEKGNIHKEISQNGAYIEYNYDSLGNVTNVKSFDNSKNLLGESKFKYKYDENGNWIVRIIYDVNGKMTNVVQRQYEYYHLYEVDETAKKEQDKTSFKFLSNLSQRFENAGYISGTPNGTLSIIALSLTFIFFILSLISAAGATDGEFFELMFHPKIAAPGKPMRMWMFNKEPYIKFTSITLFVIASFLASVILLWLIGGLVFVLLWIFKWILWCLIIIGWIALIGGIITAICGFAGNSEEIGGTGIICAPIGGVIVFFKNGISAFGERLLNWGFDFFHTLNLFEWGVGLFKNFWDVIICVCLLPLCFFLGIALIAILISLFFYVIEGIAIKYYKVNRPCPSCPESRLQYTIIDKSGKAFPIKYSLRPGVYGIYHIKDPSNKILPTMFMNGKGNVPRICPNCGNIVDTKTVGTDIHVAFVGHRGSGKSFLMYCGLHLLMQQYKRMKQVDYDQYSDIEAMYKSITKNKSIGQTDIKKGQNKNDYYKATEIKYKKATRMFPYHLHFYDVAGESFNLQEDDSYRNALRFFINTNAIIFLIDPSTTILKEDEVNEQLFKWNQDRNPDDDFDVNDTLVSLRRIIKLSGGNIQKIQFYIVCVKKDMGYFETCGLDQQTISEEQIKTFISQEMGMGNSLIQTVESEYLGHVHYFATSVKDEESMKNLFVDILQKCNVDIK